jgi:hypothetical protein
VEVAALVARLLALAGLAVVGEAQLVVERWVVTEIDVGEEDGTGLYSELLNELVVAFVLPQFAASSSSSFQYCVLIAAAFVSEWTRRYIPRKISQICIETLLNASPSVVISSANRMGHLVSVVSVIGQYWQSFCASHCNLDLIATLHLIPDAHSVALAAEKSEHVDA